jgi:hypothetical protein
MGFRFYVKTIDAFAAFLVVDFAGSEQCNTRKITTRRQTSEGRKNA